LLFGNRKLNGNDLGGLCLFFQELFLKLLSDNLFSNLQIACVFANTPAPISAKNIQNKYKNTPLIFGAK